jgi:hypothetical protein
VAPNGSIVRCLHARRRPSRPPAKSRNASVEITRKQKHVFLLADMPVADDDRAPAEQHHVVDHRVDLI